METGGGDDDADDDDANEELPPSEEWGVDPLFWAHVKVAVCEVVGADAVLLPAEGTNGAVHFYRGRPTRKCEIMGYVVTLNVRDTKTIFTVDDGTGCLECIAWLNSAGDGGGASVTPGGGGVNVSDFGINLGGLRLGALVRIQGRISEYREQKQMLVRTLQACGDANAEVLFWLDWMRCAEQIEEDAAEKRKSGKRMRSGRTAS